jgi:hypothetical protein
MALRFYMDQHIHCAIIEGLRAKSIDCINAEEDGRKDFSDEDLLARSTAMDRVFVTHDSDLLKISSDWNNTKRRFAGIVYAHPLRITIGRAIRDLELIATVLTSDDLIDDVIRIPL